MTQSERKVPVQPGPGPLPGQPGGPGGPRPTEPRPGGDIDQATRSPRAMAIIAAAVVLAAMLFTAAPAEAHGGDGRSASCPVSGARVASWGCATGFESGDAIWVWLADLHNDGHCVRALGQRHNSSSWFDVGRACDLGERVEEVTAFRHSGEWRRLIIRTPHRCMTIFNHGVQRPCYKR